MNTKQSSGSGKQSVREITFSGLILRFLAALVLVLATYNPTKYSFYNWVKDSMATDSLGPLHFFLGVLLIIGWTIFLHATLQSLGRLGIILALAFFGTFVWLLVDFGWLAADSVSAMTWIALVCLAGMLTIGITWSALWRRMTGQVDVIDDRI